MSGQGMSLCRGEGLVSERIERALRRVCWADLSCEVVLEGPSWAAVLRLCSLKMEWDLGDWQRLRCLRRPTPRR